MFATKPRDDTRSHAKEKSKKAALEWEIQTLQLACSQAMGINITNPDWIVKNWAKCIARGCSKLVIF